MQNNNLPKTIYIKADEEVNSVIAKLKASKAERNVLVVESRALIMQSPVSLRLIKNEMDRLGKKILIVASDNQDIAMAKSVGFATRNSTEGLVLEKGNRMSDETDLERRNTVGKSKKPVSQISEVDDNKKERLKKLGSEEFVASGSIEKPKIKKVSGIRRIAEKSRNLVKSENVTANIGDVEKHGEKVEEEALKLGGEKENNFEDLFVNFKKNDDVSDTNVSDDKKDKISADKKKKSGAGKWWFFLGILSVVSLAFVAYLFLPKATVTITPYEARKNISLKLEVGESENEVGSEGIILRLPAEKIEKSELFSIDFPATGNGVSSNQKARGQITIYNGYSEASQILVATTRFLTEDGKLYRLVRTVTVPGMTTENGEKKPGEVVAEIVADKSGEEYNIESAKFSIPGFEGGPKYDKFYATLNQPMKGGGEGGSTLKTITKEDVEKAKEETIKRAKEKIMNEIRSEVGERFVLPENAVKVEVLDAVAFPEEGVATDTFKYQVKLAVKGIYFSADDLDKKLNEFVDKNVLTHDFPVRVTFGEMKYENVNVDFDKNTLTADLNLNILLTANIDAESVKKEIAGMGQQQIDAFVGRNHQIRELEAEIYPSILANKLPKYANRIKIVVKSKQ